MTFSCSFSPTISVVSLAYLQLFTVLHAILTPTGHSSSPAILIILSAYKLNRYGESMHRCHTLFFTWKLAASPCTVLITASWFSYRFLSSTMKCVRIPISLSVQMSRRLVIYYILKWILIITYIIERGKHVEPSTKFCQVPSNKY